MRNPHEILTGRSLGKRPDERHNRTSDNIKMDIRDTYGSVDWIQLALDRVE